MLFLTSGLLLAAMSEHRNFISNVFPSLLTRYHSTEECLYTLFEHHRTPNFNASEASSSSQGHSSPQHRRSGRAPVPPGGIHKRTGRRVSVLSRGLESLYQPCTYIHRLDSERWTAPESQISTFLKKPLEHVQSSLDHWYGQQNGDQSDDFAGMAVNLLCIPGTSILHSQILAYAEK